MAKTPSPKLHPARAKAIKEGRLVPVGTAVTLIEQTCNKGWNPELDQITY